MNRDSPCSCNAVPLFLGYLLKKEKNVLKKTFFTPLKAPAMELSTFWYSNVFHVYTSLIYSFLTLVPNKHFIPQI